MSVGGGEVGVGGLLCLAEWPSNAAFALGDATACTARLPHIVRLAVVGGQLEAPGGRLALPRVE